MNFKSNMIDKQISILVKFHTNKTVSFGTITLLPSLGVFSFYWPVVDSVKANLIGDVFGFQ